MRLLVSFYFFVACAPASHLHYQGGGEVWAKILGSIGLQQGAGGRLVILRAGTAADVERIKSGVIAVLEGDSELARTLGFLPSGAKPVPVRNVWDRHNPQLAIIWEKTAQVSPTAIPEQAIVFSKDRWTETPLAAGLRLGEGAALWLAVSPGAREHERFPYLLHALQHLGMQTPYQSRRLWAFFDASYRARVDLDWFAKRWRASGIAALHVASWHFFEPDAQRDAYLRKLIEACHRNAILVYAWVEFPHVSETFWQDHPEWREKTALGQDAHLDWRKLMNLQNQDCARQAAQGLQAMLERFDWDGVNLAELYFESLEGHANAARFTPMNDDARAAFSKAHGFDPATLFDPKSPRHHARDSAALRLFLDWRAAEARRMQEEWIGRIARPDLDLVLTHVDDRYDTRMRDLIGADSRALLPMLTKRDFTFLVEDPATVWHLGAERYPDIASRYRPITPRPERLAIDINIVERYQDVYPTKQQTGTELFRLVNLASAAFPRVALYFENSLLEPDLKLLPSAAATITSAQWDGPKLRIDSPAGLGVPWRGAALVNGNPWPFQNLETVWLPPGAHTIEPAASQPALRILDTTVDVQRIDVSSGEFDLSYTSQSRAMLWLNAKPASVELDGMPLPADSLLRLPKGQHVITLRN